VKRVGHSLYAHRTAVNELPPPARRGTILLGPKDWSVVRVDMRRGKPVAVMFGWTTDWDTVPHPALRRSVLYKREDRNITLGPPFNTRIKAEWVQGPERTYRDRPIYHRKETMLPADHPRRAEYEALTAQEEAAGLLGRRDIGRESQWAQALSVAGYELVGHTLVSVN